MLLPKILVFGANGWIGSAICNQLVKADFAVTGVFRSEPPTTLAGRGIHSLSVASLRSFVNLPLSVLLYAAIPIFYLLPSRIDKLLAKGHST